MILSKSSPYLRMALINRWFSSELQKIVALVFAGSLCTAVRSAGVLSIILVFLDVLGTGLLFSYLAAGESINIMAGTGVNPWFTLGSVVAIICLFYEPV